MSDTAAPATRPAGPPPPTDRQGHEISEKQAWGALWALLIGFFMILVDSTIVTTAIPAIQIAMNASVNGVVWVTSAYLLTYAVPLLVTGRLGDKFGPHRVFQLGLVIFTLASAWCGFSNSIGMLIAARAVQGIGAALMTPQSMAVITRLFPFNKRGAAMGVWGSTAGVATLVGPILGGVLVDWLDWRWIFFVNIPVGIFGLWRVMKKVPDLPRVSHGFDWTGFVLSAIGMFLIVFGLQEGNTYHWGTIRGIISVPLLLVLGVLVMVGFVYWETKPKEPLVPLRLFRTWNFSMGNLLTFCVGAAITSMSFPLMLFLQNVRYLSPTRAALVMVPNAVISGVLAPLVGKNLHRLNAKFVIFTGLGLWAASWFGYFFLMGHRQPTWSMVLLSIPLGVGSAMVWGPISLVTTRDLSPRDAGAGSSIFNTTRQMGSVLGSAMISMIMTRRITHWTGKFIATLPPEARAHAGGGSHEGHVAAAVAPYMSSAFADSMLLPAFTALAGALLALAVRATHKQDRHGGAPAAPTASAVQGASVGQGSGASASGTSVSGTSKSTDTVSRPRHALAEPGDEPDFPRPRRALIED